MSDYVDRAAAIYRALRESDGIDQQDVATLTTAILQEEAKDRRMEFIDEQKDRRVKDMRSSPDQSTAADSDRDRWRNDPATDAQKKALENLGVDFSDDITKGDASDLIDKARAQKQDDA